MALAVSVRFQFEDDKGKTSFTVINVPTGFSIAQFTEFAQGAAQLITNISQATVTRVSVTFKVSLAGLGLRGIPSTIGSVAKKIFLRFQTGVTGFFAQTLIPSPDENNVVAGSDGFNQAAAGVAALISMYEDGIAVTGGTMQFTNNREMDVSTVIDAREIFRRRRAS
jgi:hypothetical protein